MSFLLEESIEVSPMRVELSAAMRDVLQYSFLLPRWGLNIPSRVDPAQHRQVDRSTGGLGFATTQLLDYYSGASHEACDMQFMLLTE